MEDREYEDLESKALKVVQVLNSLKGEIEQYEDARLNTRKSLRALEKLVGSVSKASDELAQTAKQVGESDYVSLCRGLSGACDTLSKEVSALPGVLSNLIAAFERRQREANASYLAAFDDKLLAERQGFDQMKQHVDLVCKTIGDEVSGLPSAFDDVFEGQEKAHEVLGDLLIEAVGTTMQAHEKLSDALDQHARLSQEREQELLERILALEAVVGRIDRNTQKGFGKERG